MTCGSCRSWYLTAQWSGCHSNQTAEWWEVVCICALIDPLGFSNLIRETFRFRSKRSPEISVSPRRALLVYLEIDLQEHPMFSKLTVSWNNLDCGETSVKALHNRVLKTTDSHHLPASHFPNVRGAPAQIPRYIYAWAGSSGEQSTNDMESGFTGESFRSGIDLTFCAAYSQSVCRIFGTKRLCTFVLVIHARRTCWSIAGMRILPRWRSQSADEGDAVT